MEKFNVKIDWKNIRTLVEERVTQNEAKPINIYGQKILWYGYVNYKLTYKAKSGPYIKSVSLYNW